MPLLPKFKLSRLISGLKTTTKLVLCASSLWGLNEVWRYNKDLQRSRKWGVMCYRSYMPPPDGRKIWKGRAWAAKRAARKAARKEDGKPKK